MQRDNLPYLSFLSRDQNRSKRAGRAQFDVDIFRPRQETQEQLAALAGRQIVGAAFLRMSRGNDDRRRQDRQLVFYLGDDRDEMIQTQFEEVRRLRHGGGAPEIGGRADYDDDRGFGRTSGWRV